MADTVTTKSKSQEKKYKCPYCDSRYERKKLISHIDKTHEDEIPEGYTATRIVFNLINKKDHGTCIICKKESPWNEEKGRYDRLCGSKECHDKYVEMANKRTKDKYGKSKEDMLNDPEFQEKMLANRSISGKYTMRDGTEKTYVGSYEKKFLEFMDQYFNINSEDLDMPGPIIEYEYGGKKRKWITDAYYIPYNLVFDIKDGGSNPNNREMKEYREKQVAKEKAIAKQNQYNYIRLTDNNFDQMILIMLELKERLEDDSKNYEKIIRINENYNLPFGDIYDIPKVNYDYITEENTGLENVRNKFNSVKTDIDDKKISIKGINYNKLLVRVRSMYNSRKILGLFDKQYSALQLWLYNHQKISSSEMKINSLEIDLFFALELYNMLLQLADYYKMNSYASIAKKVYKKTWISKYDDKPDMSNVDFSKLNNLKYKPKDFQEEFIRQYPVLKCKYDLEGYLLSFDQGLGKTFTSICISEVLTNIKQVIIVCPNSLKENWENEIKMYYKELPMDSIYVSGKSKFKPTNKTRFLIVNNESIPKIYPFVLSKDVMIIVDESHNFRYLDTAQTKNLIKLKDMTHSKDCLMMSGTPVKASPAEIVPVLRMIDPYFTDDLAKRYAKYFDSNSEAVSVIVKARLNRSLYRRTKDQVLQLPPKNIYVKKMKVKNENKYYVDVVKAQINERRAELVKFYEKDTKEAKPEWEAMVRKYSSYPSKRTTEDYIKFVAGGCNYFALHESLEELYRSFLTTYVYPNIKDKQAYKRMRYLSSVYVYVMSKCNMIAIGEILIPLKQQAFIQLFTDNKKEIIDMINECPKKTIIFSIFVPVIDALYEQLTKAKIGCVKITGDTKNRFDVIDQFKNDDTVDVLLATSQTLSTGFTLCEASQMFFFGPPYRKADFNQCCDRIYRIGQTETVNIYNCFMESAQKNITDNMEETLEWSGNMADALIETPVDESAGAGAIIGTPSASKFIVNYTLKNTFTEEPIILSGVCDDYMSNLRIFDGNKLVRISLEEFMEMATNVRVFRIEYPVNYIEEANIVEEVMPYCRYLDIVRECVTSTIKEGAMDTNFAIPLIPMNKDGNVINYYRDINGVFAKNDMTGLRSASYNDVKEIKSDVLEYLRKGKI